LRLANASQVLTYLLVNQCHREGTDIKQIRSGYQLSQGEFAALLGISVATLQNWEQGRRTPDGPAKILLQVAAKHPDAVWDVVRPAIQQSRSKRSKRVASATA
jgi:DNA-binding transcriptional regulator YiaG